MTSIFSIVLLVLYARLLQHAQLSTEQEKEQSEYAINKARNKARNKAVLLFGFTSFCLVHVINNNRLVTS